MSGSQSSPTSEVVPHKLARLRPRCPGCREFAEWVWRCCCFLGDPPRVCDCEDHGAWVCLECGGFDGDIPDELEVAFA